MKRWVTAIILAAITTLSLSQVVTLNVAADGEEAPVVESSITHPIISEIYTGSNVSDYYIELYFGSAMSGKMLLEYYLITASTIDSKDLSQQLSLPISQGVEAGSYWAFTPNSIPSSDETKYVWLCNRTLSNSELDCQTATKIDLVKYDKPPGKDYSLSRDIDDYLNGNVPILTISKKTPDMANDFDLDSEDDKDTESDQVDYQYCSALRLSEVSTNEQWIELYNNSNFTIQSVNLKNCNLSVQYGDKVTNGKPTYKDLDLADFISDGLINPYEYLVIGIEGTNLSLAKSVKDRSVLIHDSESDYDETNYSTQKADTSLAHFADGWKITYAPTPGAENIYQQWQTCEVGKHINEATGNCVKDTDPPAECAEGQYRNPETGRCKKYPEEKVLAECAEGQYRNPETGRCKKYPEEKVLAECAEGQYRNPLTNRCKKISTSDDLVPCAEGYERNPETNRCRKIRASDSAEYAIDPMGVSTENRTWAIIGAAGLGAIGLLIAVQFRHEIMHGFNKLFRRKK